MAYLALAFLMLVIGMRAAAAEGALARIKKDGVLHVANSGVYPPFESVQNGKLVGFDIDLTGLLAKQLGVRPKIEMIDFKALIPALKSGRVDALVTAMTYTPGRAEQIAFSTPYYRTALVIITRDNELNINSKADLAGKRLGAEIGSTGEREIDAITNAKEVKTYDSLMLALQDLQNGRLDAVVATLPPSEYLIHRNFHNLKIVYRYNKGYVAVNTRKRNTKLLAAINHALKTLKKNGRLRQLQVRWFGEASD